MRTIQISYDLTRDGDEYPELIAYIRAHDGTKPLRATWFIKTARTALEVRDDVAALAEDEDEFLVVENFGVVPAVTGEAVGGEMARYNEAVKRVGHGAHALAGAHNGG